MIAERDIDAIQDGLISVTFDSAERTITFRYEAGAPIMVNECIAWSSESVDEVVFYDGERMAGRYRLTAPDMWDDELGSGRACTLAPHHAIRGEGGGRAQPRRSLPSERPSEG